MITILNKKENPSQTFRGFLGMMNMRVVIRNSNRKNLRNRIQVVIAAVLLKKKKKYY